MPAPSNLIKDHIIAPTNTPPAMSSHETPTKTIDDRIQSLPQELQDAILEAHCQMEVERVKTVNICYGYRPPYFLQLNRHTRASIAPAYYGRTTFSFIHHIVSNTKTITRMKAWLNSLPPAHRTNLRALEIVKDFQTRDWQWVDSYIQMVLNSLRPRLEHEGFSREAGLLSMR